MYQLFKTYIDFFKDKPIYLIFYIIIILLYSFFNVLVIPQLISKTINNISKNNLNNVIVFLIIAIIIFIVLYYIKINSEHYLVPSIQAYTRYNYGKNLFEELKNNYVDKSESKIAIMLDLIATDTRDLFLIIYNDLLPFILSFVILVIYFLYTIPKFALLNVFQIISFIIILYIAMKKTKYECNKSIETIMLNYAMFGDQIKNMLSIIFDNNYTNELVKLKECNTNTQKQYTQKYKYLDCISTSFVIITYIYFILFIYMVYISVKNKVCTAKYAVGLIIIALVYVDLSLNLSYEIDRPITSIISLNKFSNYFLEQKKISKNRKQHTVKCPQIDEIIFKNVYFKYPQSTQYVLNNISIHLKKNKINVIVGRSGIGKTTLMKLIIGLYDVNKGEILLNNININTLLTEDITKSVYYVNQKTILFDIPIIDNIIYATNIPHSQVIDLLNKYELMEYFSTLDKTIYTNAGINGSNLSLGMQKIVVVIKGIIKQDKSTIIFDEPLTSLDDNTKNKIVKLIIENTKNKTVVIITHDDIISHYADNKIIM